MNLSAHLTPDAELSAKFQDVAESETGRPVRWLDITFGDDTLTLFLTPGQARELAAVIQEAIR